MEQTLLELACNIAIFACASNAQAEGLEELRGDGVETTKPRRKAFCGPLEHFCEAALNQSGEGFTLILPGDPSSVESLLYPLLIAIKSSTDSTCCMLKRWWQRFFFSNGRREAPKLQIALLQSWKEKAT